MKSSLFAVGHELAFRFQGLPEELVARVEDYLSYSPGDRDEQPGGAPLVISADPPPDFAHRPHEIVLAEGDLIVRRMAGAIRFEMPGIVGWCETDRERGGIHLRGAGPEAIGRFVGLALAPLLSELARCRDVFVVHAAAVADGKRGVLMPGPSGTGKSTIFRRCHEAGMAVLSDDLVWLAADPALQGGYRLRAFPRGSYGKGAPAPTVSSASLCAIVRPHIGSSAALLERIGAAEALEALLEQGGLLGSDPGPYFRIVARAVATVPAFRLTVGPRTEDAAIVLSRLLAGDLTQECQLESS